MSRHARTAKSACLGIALKIFIGMALAAPSAAQEKRYDTGASDTTIKIGNTAPYSGPLSSNGIIARTEAAYFKMINDQGGVSGRKIEFISYDEAYSPPKTVEQTRKLIESDEVLLLFNPLGTPTTMSVIKYVNARKVPQLFIAAGGTIFGDHDPGRWASSQATRAKRASTASTCGITIPKERSPFSRPMTILGGIT